MNLFIYIFQAWFLLCIVIKAKIQDSKSKVSLSYDNLFFGDTCFSLDSETVEIVLLPMPITTVCINKCNLLLFHNQICLVFTTAHFRNTLVIRVHKTVKAVTCRIEFHFTNHYFQLPLFHSQAEQNMPMKM